MNDEYISKQRAKDLMGCCLASAKANLKVETSIFKKAEFESIIKTIESMIDVVGAVEAADVQPVSQWISVKDRLPEKEQKVLVFYKAIGEKNRIHNDVIATNWRKSNGDFIPFGAYEITHWMPLPEPPKDGDAECQ